MCGILGRIRWSGALDEGVLRRMLDTLTMRGPDAEGMVLLSQGRVGLGHRRLSIIDLSDAGRQPMANEDETIWLTFNGEIYNYRELRRTLEEAEHRFHSATDSEVILHGYEQWGDDVVDRLDGIFAFGIWDVSCERLLLARDRLGVKPLYYMAGDDGIAFASQPRALIEGPSSSRRINPSALSAYLAYGYVPGEQCIFEGMAKLPAAHRLVCENRRVSVQRYWHAEYRPKITRQEEAWEVLRDGVCDAVVQQMVSDVPIGVFLSGGIDSSIVSAVVAKNSDQAPASFTIGFHEAASDERVFAAEVARELGTRHYVDVLDMDRAADMLCDFAEVYDEPFLDSSGLPTLAVSRLARRHGYKVILSGDGGDEVFVGYRWYDAYLAALAQTDGRSAGWWSTAGRMRRALTAAAPDPVAAYFPLIGFLTAKQQKAIFAHEVRGAVQDHLAPLRAAYPADCPAVTSAQLMDLQTYLVDDILTKVDRASMACGVEVRVPLLDHRLVEFAFSVDSELLYAGGERKAALKRAVKDLVPACVLTSRKKGFSIPMFEWMTRGMQRLASTLVCDGVLVEDGFLHQRSIRKLFRRNRDERVTWLLLAAELWARRWYRGEDPGRLREYVAKCMSAALGQASQTQVTC